MKAPLLSVLIASIAIQTATAQVQVLAVVHLGFANALKSRQYPLR
jgi:hypothetical protein